MTTSKTARSHPRVIFLFGIMPRCGTNWLNDLLCMHPDFGGTVKPSESFLLANARHLERFVDDVHHSWNMLWKEHEEELKEPLLRVLGHGIEAYLYDQTKPEWIYQHTTPEELPDNVRILPRVRVARTPSVENLDLFSRLTDAKAVIIIREGRSVLESGIRSFGWPFEEYLHRWADSARLIRNVALDNPQMMVVHYEELLDDKEAVLRRLFAFLETDDADYPCEKDAKVRGSSALLDEGKYWEGTDKPADFDPRRRWAHWSERRHARFNSVAGSEMRAWGYPLVAVNRLKYLPYNVVAGLAWPLRRQVRPLARRILPKSWRERILWWRGQRYRQTVTKKKRT